MTFSDVVLPVQNQLNALTRWLKCFLVVSYDNEVAHSCFFMVKNYCLNSWSDLKSKVYLLFFRDWFSICKIIGIFVVLRKDHVIR